MGKTMAKTKKQGPGENDAAWADLSNPAWLKSFPFVGGMAGNHFTVKAAIVPAARGAIIQGSSLLLAMDFSKNGVTEGVNLTFSVAQAKAVSAILDNFISSRETAREAIRAAFIGPDGDTRWGSNPQAV